MIGTIFSRWAPSNPFLIHFSEAARPGAKMTEESEVYTHICKMKLIAFVSVKFPEV
jgi:hypothetical protein